MLNVNKGVTKKNLLYRKKIQYGIFIKVLPKNYYCNSVTKKKLLYPKKYNMEVFLYGRCY